MRDYSEVPALSSVYLEDSYVVGIHVGLDRLAFVLEAVLTEEHPQYRSPAPGEHYCYVSASLVIRSLTKLRWISVNRCVFTDAAGQRDRGNIGSLKWENDRWRAVGDWEEFLIVTGAPPTLDLHAQCHSW